ncbi:MAG: hypothetical protein V2J07_00695 [Anaerolineae bacterium]|jgi:hypothetical protein|nr:hypothetical protein [Anaerolineae bacterium]
MFKRILKTGIDLTRIGIQTVTKAAATINKPVTMEHADIEAEGESKSARKTAISGFKANLLRQATFKHDKIQVESNSKRTRVQKFRIPDLDFIAAGSNKVINLRKIRQPAVLFISHRENAKEAAALNWQLIQPYIGSHLPFFTANIIVLNEFPPFLHPVVRRELLKAYKDIIKDYVKDSRLAEKIVHLLPDWRGASLDSFHIANRRPTLAAVILTPDGTVQNVIYDASPLAAIQQELTLQTR